MRKTKSEKPRRATDVTHRKLGRSSPIAEVRVGLARAPPDGADLITGPKLREKLGISAVTLWRWRHDETSGFPPPKIIKRRMYFPLTAVIDWVERQPDEEAA